MALSKLNWIAQLTLTLSVAGLIMPLEKVGALTISNFQPTVYAGSPNAVPPDSPDNRVDPNLTTSPYAGVGSVNGGCTGAAIGATYILSAAHCYTNNQNVTFYLNYGSQTSYTGVVQTYPGAVFPFDDVAVITLDTPLPSGVPIYELYRSPIPLDSVIGFVGYGVSGDGLNNSSAVGGSTTVKRVGFNVADFFFEGNGTNLNPTFSRTPLVGFDFDGPDSSTSFSGGLTLGNTSESTYGSGDSGSPNFVLDNNVLKIAGVSTAVFGVTDDNNITYNHPLFGSGGTLTDISSYTSWIDGITGFTPVPFEFSPALGIVMLGVWATVVKFIAKRKP